MRTRHCRNARPFVALGGVPYGVDGPSGVSIVRRRADLKNGLTIEETATLAHTPHVDQAVTLILSGLLLRLANAETSP